MYKILVLDNNLVANREAAEVWAKYNGELTTVQNVQDMIIAMSKEQYHMLVLVEDFLGGELVNTVATLSGLSDLPLMVLTSTPTDQIHDECVNWGVVVYLTIPEKYESGVARGLAVIKAVQNTQRSKPLQLVGEKGLLICPDFRRVLVEGKQISLTPTEYDILLYLVKSGGRPRTFEQILRKVWGFEYEDSSHNLVWCQVKQLKKKLRTETSEYVVNVRGIGYQFEP